MSTTITEQEIRQQPPDGDLLRGAAGLQKVKRMSITITEQEIRQQPDGDLLRGAAGSQQVK